MYREAGTYPGTAVIDGETVTVPADAAGSMIHIILEAVGYGALPLVSYRRVVIRVGS